MGQGCLKTLNPEGHHKPALSVFGDGRRTPRSQRLSSGRQAEYPGIAKVAVSYKDKMATVNYDDAKADMNQLSAITKAGYLSAPRADPMLRCRARRFRR